MNYTQEQKQKIQETINKIVLLQDIQDSYINEIPDTYKQEIKFMLHNTRVVFAKFTKTVDKILKATNQHGLGIASDIIKEMIDDKIEEWKITEFAKNVDNEIE